jgi:hypothetical protein
MSHGRSCAGPRTREVGKHLGEVAVSDGEGDTDPRNYRVSFDKIGARLGFRCDHTVQDYLARLTSAIQAGIFPDVAEPAFGNYTVRNIEPTY